MKSELNLKSGRVLRSCPVWLDGKRQKLGMDMVANQRQQPRHRGRSLWSLVLALLLGSGLLGAGLAATAGPPTPGTADTMAQATPAPTSQQVGTVDIIPQQLQLSQEIYLKTCASCHLAIPPQVLPTETWQILIQDSNHYGATLQLPKQPELNYLWTYLQTFSRPLNQNEDTPYRVAKSRYFKLLHPRVKFSEPVTLQSCGTCHPAAAQFNFRSLTANWQDAP